MSLTIRRTGAVVEVLEGAHTLPEGEAVLLFTGEEIRSQQRDRLAELAIQMPSFLRGDEEEDAEELFFL